MTERWPEMPRTETIPRGLKCKIRWYIDDIEQIPAPPERARKWSDIFASHPSGDGEASLSIGTKLRDAELLQKTEDGRYRATQKLAEYMLEQHDTDIDSRPTFGLTTSSEPSPEPELLVPPEDRSGSEGARSDSTTIHQAKLDKFAGGAASGSKIDQSGGEVVG